MVDSRCHMARASQAGHGELPGPFQHRFRRTARQDDHQCQGLVPRGTHGAAGLGRPARHLRSRERRTGRSRRVRNTANRHRHADERSDWDAGHDHLQRTRCEFVHGRGVPALGQPLRGRDDGQLDPWCGTSDHSRRRAGGPAHDPGRERHQLPVPERAAIADSVHQRSHGHLHGDQGRRPASFVH